ncbi:hypothetical protein VTK73DRAFT_8781 [Phialemonium thermophilum]|uniref:CST complex subunit STN1 n=1 Tax=Phialemonium thermophilum TaxID=223376 RepID=A0ABR3XMX2_9PEZI
MTRAAPSSTIYPRYCFHLSPTIYRLCPLRATDVHALRTHPGFEGQDLYFHLNHPIRWVRVVGVIVAIDEYEARCIYTLDDSSGETIQCVVNKPRSASTTDPKSAPSVPRGANASKDASAGTGPDIDSDIDVGDVVDVRGGVNEIRALKQICVQKVVHLRSTEQEVRVWNKIAQFRRDVLDEPWILDKKAIWRCQQEALGRPIDAPQVKRASRNAKEEAGRARSAADGPEETGPSKQKSQRLRTGLEKKVKRPRSAVPVEGRYKALGI